MKKYIYLLFIIFFSCTRTMEKEIHYIPEGYMGKVYIFFNKSNGKDREFLSDARLYKIGKSGVLKTKFNDNTGWTDGKNTLQFFYQAKDSLKKIPSFIDLRVNKDIKPDSNMVVIGSYGYSWGTYWDNKETVVLSYEVDSIKNIGKKRYKLNEERFYNWNK